MVKVTFSLICGRHTADGTQTAVNFNFAAYLKFFTIKHWKKLISEPGLIPWGHMWSTASKILSLIQVLFLKIHIIINKARSQ